MVKSVLRVGILLVVLCVADGQRVMPEDSHCSYTFNVPASECSHTPREDRLLKSSMTYLQAQFRLLASKLTDENEKLKEKIATIEAGAVGGSYRSTYNLKQCSRRGLNDERGNGLIYSCDFVKKRTDTVLRVVWNGSLRLRDTGPKSASTRRWFFTINGQECTEPETIDTQLFIRAKGTITHRPAYVEGYCRGIAAGNVNVGWNVGDIVNWEGWDQIQYNVGESWTGWVATVRIIVEEVGVEHADTVIV